MKSLQVILNPETLLEIYHFILKRKKEKGGFAATYSMPATIEDTFYALKTFNTLNQLLPISTNFGYLPSKDKALKSWLKKILEKIYFYKTSSKNLWYLYEITLNISASETPNLTHFLSKVFSEFFQNLTKLENYFYVCKLAKVLKKFISSKKFFKFKTVRELYINLWLLKNNFISSFVNEEEIFEWLNRCQTPEGGFGFFPYTTSYLDNTYFALKSYELLEIKPSNPEKIIEFLKGCYVGKGGFARKPGGAPFLESTYHAVKCIKILLKFKD